MKYVLSAIAVLLTMAGSPVFGQGQRWGQDVLIHNGYITGFDVDYTSDGTVYVVLQEESAENRFLVYTSIDYGYTWDLRATYVKQSAFGKIRVIAADAFLFIFYIEPAADKLCVTKIDRATFAHLGDYAVSFFGTAIPDAFDVTRTLESGYLLFAGVWESTTSDGCVVYVSSDFGETWAWELWTGPIYGYDPSMSLASGPASNIYLALSMMYGAVEPDSLEILIMPRLGGGWGYTYRVTYNSSPDFNPHVVASTEPGFPAIWIAHTLDSGMGDLDLYVASILGPDSIVGGGEWTTTCISASFDNEYCADVRCLNTSANRWPNMAYVQINPGVCRDVYRTYSNGANPTVWSTPDTVNDHDVQASPAVSPRIAYAPGAPPGGAAIVYAGYDNLNVYFDAPWFLGIVEHADEKASSFSCWPNPLCSDVPLAMAFSHTGVADISVFDVSGRRVMHVGSIPIGADIYSLSLSNLQNGIYFLDVVVDGKQHATKKLVISR